MILLEICCTKQINYHIVSSYTDDARDIWYLLFIYTVRGVTLLSGGVLRRYQLRENYGFAIGIDLDMSAHNWPDSQGGHFSGHITILRCHLAPSVAISVAIRTQVNCIK